MIGNSPKNRTTIKKSRNLYSFIFNHSKHVEQLFNGFTLATYLIRKKNLNKNVEIGFLGVAPS